VLIGNPRDPSSGSRFNFRIPDLRDPGKGTASAVPLDSKCVCALAPEVAKKIFFPLATGGEQAGQRLNLWHTDSVAELHALS
jgi:hypothetical protein